MKQRSVSVPIGRFSFTAVSVVAFIGVVSGCGGGSFGTGVGTLSPSRLSSSGEGSRGASYDEAEYVREFGMHASHDEHESIVRDIIEYEKEARVTIPREYKKFLLENTDGTPVDIAIESVTLDRLTMRHPRIQDEVTVNYLLSWQEVKTHIQGLVHGLGIPPKHLVIGTTNTSVDVLLSLDRRSYGRVSLWPHSVDDWEVGSNQYIYPVARSFAQFYDR